MRTGATGGRLLQLTDLRGNVMGALPIADGAAQADWTGLAYRAADEFGNPTDLGTGTRAVSDGTAPGKDGRYGWLGADQRSADALGGVLLMGARLYDPATGRFQSVDSVRGGNATEYDYCAADPVNCTDLTGRYMTVGMKDRGPRLAPRSPWLSANKIPISSKPFEKLHDYAGPKPGASFHPHRYIAPSRAKSGADILMELVERAHPPSCDPSICRPPPRNLEPLVTWAEVGEFVGTYVAPAAGGCISAMGYATPYVAPAAVFLGVGSAVPYLGACGLGGVLAIMGGAEVFG